MKYLISVLLFVSSSLFAIDNPDAPDRVGEFEKRIAQYEQKINNSTTTSEFRKHFYQLELALDKELNAAYKILINNLDDKSKEKLKRSQRQWIKYRDAEFEFIATNWTRENFGTSSALSRGSYRTSFIKDRVVRLLQYSINYL